MKDCGEYQELISLMPDGELAEPQKTGLLRHIEACPDCRRVYSAFKTISLSLSEEREAPPALAGDVMAAIKDGNVSPLPSGRPEDGKAPRKNWWPRVAVLAACLAVALIGAAALPSLRAGSSRMADGAEPAAFGMMGNGAGGGESTAGGAQGDEAAEAAPENDGSYAADEEPEEAAEPESSLQSSTTAVSPEPYICARSIAVTEARVYEGGELILELEEDEAPELASLLEYAGPYGGETPDEGGFSVNLSDGDSEYELEVYVVGGGLACLYSGETYTAAGSAADFLEAVDG